MKQEAKLVAVLYSFEQEFFHIEYLDEYTDSNVRATINKKDHQYRMIALVNSFDDAIKVINNYKKAFPEVFIERSSNLSL